MWHSETRERGITIEGLSPYNPNKLMRFRLTKLQAYMVSVKTNVTNPQTGGHYGRHAPLPPLPLKVYGI